MMRLRSLLMPLPFPLSFLSLLLNYPVTAQTPEALSQFFEGKSVIVKMDMPGSQKGVDVYPNNPRSLNVKDYARRLKSDGTSLRNGDSVMITKVKVKSDNVEFQLGGGGYGTAGDLTDSSVHFKPADKSDHEKELEDQLSKETDSDRRRSLSAELDDVRRDRDRRDRRERSRAENDAETRKQQISAGRANGGSRFNLRFDKRTIKEGVTPQAVMAALAQYMEFPSSAFGPNGSEPTPGAMTRPEYPSAPSSADSARELRKGLTRAEVDSMFGPPTDVREQPEGDMTRTICIYPSARETLKAEFVNGVLVQYSLVSR